MCENICKFQAEKSLNKHRLYNILYILSLSISEYQHSVVT